MRHQLLICFEKANIVLGLLFPSSQSVVRIVGLHGAAELSRPGDLFLCYCLQIIVVGRPWTTFDMHC